MVEEDLELYRSSGLHFLNAEISGWGCQDLFMWGWGVKLGKLHVLGKHFIKRVLSLDSVSPLLI